MMFYDSKKMFYYIIMQMYIEFLKNKYMSFFESIFKCIF
jgi:hypothetical protein